MPVDETHRADGVFQGGGGKGLWLVGAMFAAILDSSMPV
jgi:hypothetical protein